MKTELNQNIERGVYIAPSIKPVEIHTEGVLCASAENEDYNFWEFEW